MMSRYWVSYFLAAFVDTLTTDYSKGKVILMAEWCNNEIEGIVTFHNYQKERPL